jgi:hydroxymethylpyrimidine pyrophosphatase-like HAD family hydrolase
MSYYLNPNNTLKRLRDEWNKHKSLIIAVDFDSTIHPYQHYEVKDDSELIRQLVKELYDAGCTIIIWTASDDHRHDEIKRLLDRYDIKYHHFNENSPTVPYQNRKIYANAFLDDRSGLYEVYTALRQLLTERKVQTYLDFFEGFGNQTRKRY